MDCQASKRYEMTFLHECKCFEFNRNIFLTGLEAFDLLTLKRSDKKNLCIVLNILKSCLSPGPKIETINCWKAYRVWIMAEVVK